MTFAAWNHSGTNPLILTEHCHTVQYRTEPHPAQHNQTAPNLTALPRFRSMKTVTDPNRGKTSLPPHALPGRASPDRATPYLA